MLSRRRVCLACVVAVFVCLVAAPASAQPADKRTTFTFSGPVAMPGITLPAGEYLFRVANPDTSRNVVQVLSGDGSKPLGLFFSIPAERLEPTSTPEVRFMETPAGTPAAIKTWWYPGQRAGHEFIYPKDQARSLAKAAREPVLTTQEDTTKTEETNTADLARIASGGQETQVSATGTPTPATPHGGTQAGAIAAESIAIPVPVIPAIGSTTPLLSSVTHAQADTVQERFTFTAANGTQAGPGGAGRLELVVTRWSSDAERDRVHAVVTEEGPDQLRNALGDAYAAGWMHWPGQLDYTLRYARRAPRPDGGEDVVLVTDSRTWIGWDPRHSAGWTDGPFTVIQLRLNKDGAGEGRLSLGATKIRGDKDAGIVLDDYASQPIVLTEIRRDPSSS